MFWISFGTLPCRKKRILMTARVSTLLKSRASLTSIRPCSFPGLAKDLSAPRYYLWTYLLTSWCRVLLEQLTGLHLVKNFSAFHGTRRFITALTSVRHLSLSWASLIHSIFPTSHLLEIHPNIIHPSTPRSPQWSLSLRFPHQDPIRHPFLTHARHMPSPSHSSRFYHPHNNGWAVQIISCESVMKIKSHICL
jgi:hypothetical protein